MDQVNDRTRAGGMSPQDDAVAFLDALEKAPYPTARFAGMGESLRHLTRNEFSYVPPLRTTMTPVIDCIVVPTRRRASESRKALNALLRLAVSHRTKLVIFLCSNPATKEDIARIASQHTGIAWLALDGPFDHDQLADFKTSQSVLAYGSEKDISQKRNAALLLARSLGYESLLFVDDDVLVTDAHLRKAADLLQGATTIVGFSARHYYDNSVVVHADRWASTRIDSFIGTGAMAIKLTAPMLSFFPHIYNEDWMFPLLYCLQYNDAVTWAGTIEQRRYNPYRTIARVTVEEPGDLLAEALVQLTMTLKTGLQAKADLSDMIALLCERADEFFWEQKINERIAYIRTIQRTIRRTKLPTVKRYQALRALQASFEVLVGANGRAGIKAADLAGWVRAWAEDVRTWNTVVARLAPAATVGEALRQLGLQNAHLSSVPTHGVPQDRAQADTVALDPASHRAVSYRPRAAHIENALRTTHSIEMYMQRHGFDISHIVISASRLRFDRPVASLTDSKPILTISMIIADGEPTAAIVRAVRAIAGWNYRHMPVQLILWIYSSRPWMQGTAAIRQYRDSLVAQCLPAVAGTNIRICSSLSRVAHGTIAQAIDDSLVEMAFAYWKCKVTLDQPVYVVNSRNEPLRWGMFWQLLERQQLLPTQPLQTYIEDAGRGVTVPALPLGEADDRVALATARRRLAHVEQPAGRWQPLNWLTPTGSMSRTMRRARLSWARTDDYAHDLHVHHASGEDILGTAARIVCIPVAYRPYLAGDYYRIANDIVAVLAPAGRKSQPTACVVSVYADASVPWDDMEAFRTTLLARCTALVPWDQVFFVSWTYRTPAVADTTASLRLVAAAVVRYGFWLQNHTRHVKIVWRSLRQG